MKLNWGTTMPFPEKFLHNKRDTMEVLDATLRWQGMFARFFEQPQTFQVLKFDVNE